MPASDASARSSASTSSPVRFGIITSSTATAGLRARACAIASSPSSRLHDVEARALEPQRDERRGCPRRRRRRERGAVAHARGRQLDDERRALALGALERRSGRRAPRRSPSRCRARARCPGSARSSAVCERKNRSKSRSRSASGMPMPVSETSTLDDAVVQVESTTSTRPPDGVNLIAFETRLSSSCARRPPRP